MSNRYDEPWSTREKVELLVNIIQGQHNDIVAHLVQHVQVSGIVPQWQSIALPQGRSFDASRAMFDTLIRETRVQHSYSFGPPSAGPYQSHPHHSRVFTEPIQPHNAPRAIQPRPARSTDSPAPASSNGEGLTIFRTAGPELGSEKRKKRGRPTKEEAEERDRLLAAEGKVYEPKKRPTKKFRASTSTSIPTEDIAQGDPELREPSPDRKQTPGRAIEPKEDSSSEKRRKLRSQESHSAPTTTSLQTSTSPRRIDTEKPAESPSDRFMARFSSSRGAGNAPPPGDSSGFHFVQPSTSRAT